jgi:hypothetical protein
MEVNPMPLPLKLVDHLLSSGCNFLFNNFAVSLHIWRPFPFLILKMCHAVVIRNPLKNGFDVFQRYQMYLKWTSHISDVLNVPEMDLIRSRGTRDT